MFNEMFRCFLDKKLISSKQSGFKPDDSGINQLLSISHEIYKSFDDGLKVRSVFVDRKFFIKSGMKGVIFKLEQNDISGDLLNILGSFLNNRKQRVVLNGHVSVWASVNAGVPQGSILGPLSFLIYLNDLSYNLSSTVKLLAHDTSLFSVTHDISVSAGELNEDSNKISD